MPMCVECLRPIDPSEGDLQNLRMTHKQCWEALPWQEKLSSVIIGCSIKRIAVWDKEYIRLSAQVMEALGEVSATGDSLIRRARDQAMPLLPLPPGWKLDLDRAGWYFTAAHPNSWRTRRKVSNDKGTVEFSSPDNGEHRLSIAVSVTFSSLSYLPPGTRLAAAAASLRETISEAKDAVWEEARDGIIDDFPSVSTSGLFKAGILFKKESFGILTIVDAGNRLFSLTGRTSPRRKTEFEAIWEVFLEHFRIEPLPDPEYMRYLLHRRQKR